MMGLAMEDAAADIRQQLAAIARGEFGVARAMGAQRNAASPPAKGIGVCRAADAY